MSSPAPQGPRPRLSLAGAVRVLCEIEKVAVAVQRGFLQQESVPEASLYLGQPSCSVRDSNGTHVFLAAAWSECGTLVQSVSPGRGAARGWGWRQRAVRARHPRVCCCKWGTQRRRKP